MIRKLRRKFALTNMLLVALVLLMVFAALVASNYQRLANQSRTALRAALLWSDEGPDRFEFAAGPPEEASRVSMVPVFTVTLDENGEAAEVMGVATSRSPARRWSWRWPWPRGPSSSSPCSSPAWPSGRRAGLGTAAALRGRRLP